MQLKSYIIHLNRATARKPQVEYLKGRLSGSVDILDAVDAESLSDNDMNTHYERHIHSPRYPFKLLDAEIACFLSYRKIWRKIAEDDSEFALIIEDDVHLENSVFEDALQLVLKNANSDSFIRFPVKKRETISAMIDSYGETHLFYPKVIGLGMQVQLIGKSVAKNLLEVTERFDRPVDTFLQMSWVSGTKSAIVYPSGVSELSDALGGSTIGKPLQFWAKLHREIARPIYRYRLRRKVEISSKQLAGLEGPLDNAVDVSLPPFKHDQAR